jgi:electron transfer flavoprotein beta subunit
MKLLVAVKRVVDPNVRITVRPEPGQIDTQGLKTAMNPFDEVAVEQAVRMKEAGDASEVVLVSIGPGAAKDTLRAGLAMGADRGILVETPQANLDSLGVAKLLAEVVARESPDMVLLGKQSIDADAAQCGPMLAAMLGWPQATFVSKMKIDDGQLTATKDTESGSESILMQLPAVVTADLRLADPRYVTLPNVMSARRKPLSTLTATDLVPAERLAPRLSVVSVAAVDAQRTVTKVRALRDKGHLVMETSR